MGNAPAPVMTTTTVITRAHDAHQAAVRWPQAWLVRWHRHQCAPGWMEARQQSWVWSWCQQVVWRASGHPCLDERGARWAGGQRLAAGTVTLHAAGGEQGAVPGVQAPPVRAQLQHVSRPHLQAGTLPAQPSRWTACAAQHYACLLHALQ